ncbi:MAG: immunoglobulin-like domain-containing protein [Thermococcus sp.]
MSVKRAVLAVLIIAGLVAGYFLVGSSGSAKASPDKKAPVTLSLDRERYSPTDTMVMTITNNGNETVTVGYPFELYREENGEWVNVNVDLMFIQSVVQLEPGKSWTQKVSLSQLKLSSGHYKIVKKVSTQQMTLTVSAEFYIEG